MKWYERAFNFIAGIVITLAGVLIVLYYVLDSRTTNTQNNGYVRVINCILTVPATERTQEDIETCFEAVETDLGIKLQRYQR